MIMCFFIKQKTAYEMRISDWSSDVCSSDLLVSDRMRRVNESLRAVLSEAVGDLKDPRIGFVTITGVEATTDVKYATVYVSVYGDEEARRQTLDGIGSASCWERVGAVV